MNLDDLTLLIYFDAEPAGTYTVHMCTNRLFDVQCMMQSTTGEFCFAAAPYLVTDFLCIRLDIFPSKHDKNSLLSRKRFFHVQSTLVISTSVISNNRLSRRKNLVLV